MRGSEEPEDSTVSPQCWSEPSDWTSLALSFNTAASLNHPPRCPAGSRSETELIDSGGSLTDNVVRVTLK